MLQNINTDNRQNEAITHIDGPAIVLAGPGSGKTTVITKRVQYLINNAGINPANILVITFTKAAANEMKERFYRLMEQDAEADTAPESEQKASAAQDMAPKSEWKASTADGTAPELERKASTAQDTTPESERKAGVASGAGTETGQKTTAYRSVTFGTFHAVFFSILKRAYNMSAANIARDEERYAIVKNSVLRHNLETDDEREFIGNLLGEIGRVKSEQVDISNYYSVCCPADVFREIYNEYVRELKKNRHIDFEDMLVYTYELLTERKDILRAWQEKFKYILIDEFQDICKIQYDIIRLLAEPENNLFIVGDDDQSIYGFRGSKPDIMLNFPKDYQAAAQIVLDRNYRCTPQIADAAQKVIGFNTKRFKKQISTVSSDGIPVSVRRFKDFSEEYQTIVGQIRDMAGDGTDYDKIAVLYRSAGGIGSLVRKLMEAAIPFKIKDTLPDIFEHWIAKDIFAYIRLAKGGRDRGDFLQIANKPKRYIGRDYLTDRQIDFDRLCMYYEDKDWMQERILKLESDIKTVGTLNPYAAVNYIRRGIGYDGYIEEYALQHRIPAEELYDILNEIHESAREHNTFEQWEQAIADYKQRVKEVPDKDEPRVTLTTMHSSKGLEFDTVFIVDVNEGSCPHKKAVLDSDIEEERRMLYVAMTRAKKVLYIYCTYERYNKHTDVSRFLIEAGLAGTGDKR